jgi:acetylornithine/succinyldiaminopimelate/putrescine aminotransferase
MRTSLTNVALSLSDLLGRDFTEAVCAARAFASGEDAGALQEVADQKVDFYPESYRSRVDELVDAVGTQVCAPLSASACGATSEAFIKATKFAMAPLVGHGLIRIGEDGKAYLISKSEHYHASLGHDFPGYRLIENAKRLGIANITHNNTRGHITRVMEEEIVRVANGLRKEDRKGLEKVLASKEPRVLNRVINLETGSLAVEAALKMMLARFFRLDKTRPEPPYSGRIPVFLVIADNEGGKEANYHGTTILTQAMRGMWPQLYDRLEDRGLFVVKPVRINDLAHFTELIERFNRGEYKVAGFFHELILMNYGAIRLDEEFLRKAHQLCGEHDVPTCVDEIQSCIWSPELFLFREYGLEPDFVSVGKGFPGGQYPASKILFTAPMDSLNQFGALVTNGQEELASLAYLVTMAFAEANGAFLKELGEYYEKELARLAKKYSQFIDRIEGQRHLSSVFFRDAARAVEFIKHMNSACIDISAHTYKANCPPSALTKLPLTATPKMVNFLVGKMDEALGRL